MDKYDVIVVGAGPAGIFTCYELMQQNKDLKVLLIDKGHNIYDRKCPILNKRVKICPIDSKGNVGCHPACSITCGFGGAGACGGGLSHGGRRQ